MTTLIQRLRSVERLDKEEIGAFERETMLDAADRIAELEAALILAWGYLDSEHMSAAELHQIGNLIPSVLETKDE